MDVKPRQTALGNTAGMRNEYCVKTTEEQQSVEPGQYQLTNYYGFCDIDKEEDWALRERGNQTWNGYGVAMGCNVDTDSNMRIDSRVTNPRLIHQLYERPYLTVPYMGRGSAEPDLESFLRVGYTTGEKRPCNILSEVSIDVPRMEYTKWTCPQEVANVIETGWVRGGSDTRSDVRRAMYKKRCAFARSG